MYRIGFLDILLHSAVEPSIVMLNEVKDLYGKDPSLTLRMTRGRSG